MRLLTLAAVAALSAPAPAASPTPFAGFWKPVRVEHQGEVQIDAKSGAAITLVIQGNEYKVFVASDPAKDLHFRLFTASLAVDEAAKTFELTVTDGQKKGEKRHGIFQRDGDKLMLCYAPADQPRPATFAAPAGSGIFNEVWSLEKRK